MCVKSLKKKKSFRELPDSAMWWIYSLKSLPVPQPNSYSLFLHLHIPQSLNLESALYFKRQGGLYVVSKATFNFN